MVFYTTFSNISVISQVTDKLYHIVLYQVHLAITGFELTTFVVIGTDCTGSFKSNYHTIMTIRSLKGLRSVNMCLKLDKKEGLNEQ